jgi:hypothetical protein
VRGRRCGQASGGGAGEGPEVRAGIRWPPRGWSSSSPGHRCAGILLLFPGHRVGGLLFLPWPSSSPGLFLLPRPPRRQFLPPPRSPHRRCPPPLRLAPLVGGRRPVRAMPSGLPLCHTLFLLLLEMASNAFLYRYCAGYAKGLLPLQNALYCWSQP